MPIKVLFCVLLLSGASLTWATVYHVAQNGAASDDNPGTEEAPWRTISRALGTVQPGDTVLIHAGTYREWVAPQVSGTATAPITFAGAPGEEVVLTGADLVTGWERQEGPDPVYRHSPWTARFAVSRDAEGNPIYHHPGDDRHRLIGRCEQVIVDGRLLDQVLTREEMRPASFFADLEGQGLYVWLEDGSDPAAHTMEASTRQWVFGYNPWSGQGRADYIHLANVTIRYAANHAQRGALWVGGDGWQLDNIVVEWTNGCGVGIGFRGCQVNNLVSRNNGQMGMGGNPESAYLQHVKLLDNNRKGFDAGWEAGGMKFAFARDTILSDFEAARNNGPGIWFDIDNRGCVIRDSVCHDNAGHGIFIEISGGFLITNNLCYRNGTGGSWGSAGICVGESEDCLIEHNTCVENPNGLAIREQGPRDFEGRFGRPCSYRVRNFVAQFNICAYNAEYQFGLWSDNSFFGPHPSPEVGLQGTPLDPAAANLRLDYNCYFAADGQGMILWGVPWREKHRKYTDLATFTAEHAQDSNSMVAEPPFVDRAGGDYRLRAEGDIWAKGFGALFLRPER